MFIYNIHVKRLMKYSTEETEVLMDDQDFLDEQIIGVVSSFYGGDE